MRFQTISFLSDYGECDAAVGVAHSILRSMVPEVEVIDIAHGIAPFDTRAGSLVLARAANYMTPGVVVALVGKSDNQRPPVIIEVGGGDSYLVGPDNGLLASAVALVGGATGAAVLDKSSFFLESAGAVSVGRDVCIPIAAQLCQGEEMYTLGSKVDPISLLPGVLPVSERSEDGALKAEILSVDRFGNLQLNVDPEQVESWADEVSLQTGSLKRTIRKVSWDQLKSTDIGLLVDSHGLLSVVMDRRSAADELGITAGDEVTLSEASQVSESTTAQPVTLTKKGGQK